METVPLNTTKTSANRGSSTTGRLKWDSQLYGFNYEAEKRMK